MKIQSKNNTDKIQILFHPEHNMMYRPPGENKFMVYKWRTMPPTLEYVCIHVDDLPQRLISMVVKGQKYVQCEAPLCNRVCDRGEADRIDVGDLKMWKCRECLIGGDIESEIESLDVCNIIPLGGMVT